ncbi:hypothetical protein ACWGKK_39715 [Streptomyces chartreusis]
MADLISRREYPVLVDYGGWALQDLDDSQVPVLFPEDFEHGPFLRAQPHRLDFTSAGHTHEAALTVEVWSAEPPVPPGDWEEAATAAVDTSSGKLRARGIAGGPMRQEIHLSDGPQSWSVRVVCAGRAAVAQESASGVPEGVERYTAQFWPHS